MHVYFIYEAIRCNICQYLYSFVQSLYFLVIGPEERREHSHEDNSDDPEEITVMIQRMNCDWMCVCPIHSLKMMKMGFNIFKILFPRQLTLLVRNWICSLTGTRTYWNKQYENTNIHHLIQQGLLTLHFKMSQGSMLEV